MTKNIVLSSLFSLITFFSINAQNTAGLRVGSTWNNVTSKDLSGTIDFKTMSSASFGAFYELDLGHNFSVQPEINYNEKGFKSDIGKDFTLFGVNLPVGANAVTVIKYVDVPVLAKYKFGNTEGVHAYVIAGPSLGYAMNGTIDTRAKVLIDFKIASTPIDLTSNNYKRLEVAGVIGGGVALPIGDKAKLFADVRYTKSLMDVYELPITGSRLRNQGFGVGVGFAVNLK
jgi:Outer membrane protein beta-barrel domain